MKYKILGLVCVSFFMAFGGALSVSAAEMCTGNIYGSISDAEACAAIAEAGAKALGYDAECSVTISPFFAVNVNTGLTYIISPDCIVNGQSGFGAALMAGYDPQGSHFMRINPGWDTLASDLKRESESGNTADNTDNNAASPVASPVTTPSYSQSAYINSLVKVMNSIISQYKSILSQTNSQGVFNLPYLSLNPSNTNPSPSTNTTGNTVSARFLKIETINNPSWVAWLEVEAYNGAQKLSISSSTGSGNYLSGKSDGAGFAAAYDGNIWTAWNAGFNPLTDFCYNKINNNCYGWLQTAWYKLDFGAPASITKIRLLPAMTPKVAMVQHKVWGSTDGANWFLIKDMNGTFKDFYWAEFAIGQADWTTTPSAAVTAK